MLGIKDDTIFKTFEEEEWAEPSPRKIHGDRIIYETRQVDIPDNASHAVLCDFGDAQFGEDSYIGEVMPDLYRAPEIVLGIPWNEKIDIWSVGLMVSRTFEEKEIPYILEHHRTEFVKRFGIYSRENICSLSDFPAEMRRLQPI